MTTQTDLKKINDTVLLTQFAIAVQKEKQALALVIVHLAEIDRRRLYAQEGFSSLYGYLIEKYHYSEGAAYRRIQAARLSQRYAQIISLLQDGKLNLVTIALISAHLTPENEKRLLEDVMGKSKREVEFLLAQRFQTKRESVKDEIRRLPVFTATGGGEIEANLSSQFGQTQVMSRQKEPETSREMSGVLSDTAGKEVAEERRVKIVFSASEGVANKIQRAKEILRHKFPEGKLEDIIEEALEFLLEKKDPERKIKRDSSLLAQNDKNRDSVASPLAKASVVVKTMTDTSEDTLRLQNDSKSRYIPREIKLKVWKRDQGHCSYQSPEGKRCHERGGIEIDHIKPFGLGGEATIHNLRLLCRTHNQWRAIETFGNRPAYSGSV